MANIGIIGAGVAGLTSALKFAKQGNKVHIFERSDKIGGLVGVDKVTIDKESFYIEHFYHHFFWKDKNLRRLLKELDLERVLKFRKVKNQYSKSLTHVYDIFTFGILFVTPWWNLFKSINFKIWYKILPQLLERPSGYRLLMQKKFYDFWQDINLSWLWARLHARFSFHDMLFGEKLGVVEPSFKIVLDKIVLKLEKLHIQLHLNTPVNNLEETVKRYKLDKLIITTPLSVAQSLLQSHMQWKWNVPNYIGAFNIVLFLDEYPGEFYWQQYTDKKSEPFLVRVEQSLLNLSLPYKTVYIGGYIKQNNEIFKMSNNEILQLAIDKFKINKKHIKDFRVYKTRFAQHIPTVEYIKNMPPRKEFVVNIANRNIEVQILSFGNLIPWDRGVNYSILGLKR